MLGKMLNAICAMADEYKKEGKTAELSAVREVLSAIHIIFKRETGKDNIVAIPKDDWDEAVLQIPDIVVRDHDDGNRTYDIGDDVLYTTKDLLKYLVRFRRGDVIEEKKAIANEEFCRFSKVAQSMIDEIANEMQSEFVEEFVQTFAKASEKPGRRPRAARPEEEVADIAKAAFEHSVGKIRERSKRKASEIASEITLESVKAASRTKENKEVAEDDA